MDAGEEEVTEERDVNLAHDYDDGVGYGDLDGIGHHGASGATVEEDDQFAKLVTFAHLEDGYDRHLPSYSLTSASDDPPPATMHLDTMIHTHILR